MAAERNRKHILVPSPPKTERYMPHKGGGGRKAPPPASRAAHAEALKTSLKAAVSVPDGQIKHFVERLEKYALETPKKKENGATRICSIVSIRATVRARPDRPCRRPRPRSVKA